MRDSVAASPSQSEGRRLPAKILLGDSKAFGRTRGTAEAPAFCVGTTFLRALRLAGFEPEMMTSHHARRFVREGFRFARHIRGYPLTAVIQGVPCVAAFVDSFRANPTSVVLLTYKIPWTGASRLTSRLMDRVLERVIKISSLVVLATHEQRRLITKLYPQTTTVWIPVTADIDWWKPGPIQTDVLDRSGLRPGEYLLSVGDVDRNEQVPVRLAQAIGRRFVRVTRDPNTARRAEAAFRTLGATEARCLLGVSYLELRDLYRGAWAMLATPVSCHPAGLTALTEGMATGTPVLFPRNPTVEGYVADGVNGLLYDGMNVESVVAAAARLHEPGRRSSISEAARASCEQLLNFETTSQMLAEAIVGSNRHSA